MSELEGTPVLVTGASGFIGSHLVRRLVAEGAEVHGLSSSVSSVYPVRLLDLRERITVHEGNLTDRRAMDGLVETVRPQVVFHLGAYTHVGKSWQRMDECIQTNVGGTVRLLQALEGSGYRRFVYTSTSEVYGAIDVPFHEDDQVHPISPYSVAKHSGEEFCRMLHQGLGWPVVVVRPFNAYGPWQSPDRVIPEVIVRALRGQELRMTAGAQTREFNYVEDLAAGFLRLGTVPGIEGQVLNLGCGEEISMRELATRILSLMGDPITPQFGALPERPTDIPRMYCDNNRARQLLGWQPAHSLDEGLRRTIAWYRAELERPGSSFAL